MRTERVNFLDLHFDRLTFQELKLRLHAVTASSAYGYIVTPNVDHVVRVHREPELRVLYEDANLCVCDSRILRLLARLRGIRLPLVLGSDLAAALFREVINAGDRIAVIGGSVDFLRRLRLRFPAVEIVHYAPPMNLRSDAAARDAAAAFLASTNARFSFIAVGSPQQEMIAHRARQAPGASGVALCIGAGLEFLTGQQKRAPRMLQMLGLEWAHRLATNPRRLWRRYLVDGVRIFPIFLRWRASPRRRTWAAASLATLAMAVVAIYAAQSRMGHERHAPTASGVVPPAIAALPPIILPPPDLLKPLTPEEAAKENAARPFVDRPDTPASRFVLRTDAADRERALTCLTQAVYYEAAGEGDDGGRAVAQVVLNRMRHPGYPASVCGVVYQGAERVTGCQFTFACDGALQRTPVASWWDRARKIAEQALSGRVFGAVGHATHYHADYVLPYWADSLDKSVQIGRHIFYRLRSTLGDSRAFSQGYAGMEPPIPQPGGAVVLPPSTDIEQLADALISDSVKGLPAEVEKAAPAASPLAVDSTVGTLIADGDAVPIKTARRKDSPECAAGTARKQLVPLGSTDMRAGLSSSAC
jgi:exopolysaccharide biosynthesis WecB/TagA/CpsF family protein